MSMEFKAVLMVGLSVQELGISEDDFWNNIEPQGFIRIQPWYDAGWGSCFVGLPIAQAVTKRVLTSWPDPTDNIDYFEKVLGKTPQVLLTLDID